MAYKIRLTINREYKSYEDSYGNLFLCTKFVWPFLHHAPSIIDLFLSRRKFPGSRCAVFMWSRKRGILWKLHGKGKWSTDVYRAAIAFVHSITNPKLDKPIRVYFKIEKA